MNLIATLEEELGYVCHELYSLLNEHHKKANSSAVGSYKGLSLSGGMHCLLGLPDLARNLVPAFRR